MAIKERLLKQLNIVWDGLNAMPPFHSRDLNAMRSALVQARDLCFQGLSEKRFAEYKDTYDGLLLAIDQLGADAPDQGEIVSLCSELLQYTITQTQKETTFKKEIFFLPYKASMWDSLESVWRAADEDKAHCIAYVMPIPYADLTPEHTVAVWHCERGLFPKDVPTVNWEDFNLEDIHPDAIFIHNPYDAYNTVTSVEARYYSETLKRQTKLLVYIPYYTTSGEMGEAWRFCSAYRFVDYIVVQSEKFCKNFDPAVPTEKIVPLGSPKFDKVLRLCQNPPEPPPNWKKQMQGRKVYFYNTSIGGMLGNTASFLQKMKYVFDSFQKNKNVCLLWRPHPLMESTFNSNRKEFKPEYERLKDHFIRNNIGIYDDTPDIENAIALSDAYVGDSATSVTALFGLAGKPLFLLNNLIHTAPEEDDWRGDIIKWFAFEGQDWMITQGNKLYHATNHDYHYHFYCDLSEYAAGGYYSCVLELKEKVYVFPANAQDILVIGDHKVERKISLERYMERSGAFRGPVHIGNYVFLLPFQYPAIIRLNLDTEAIEYIRGLNEITVQKVNEEWRLGGIAIWQDYLLLASPSSQQVVALHSETLEVRSLMAGSSDNHCGCLGMLPGEDDDFWMVPYAGHTVTRWRPMTGEYREYNAFPEGFECHHYPFGFACEDRPFASGLDDGEYFYLIPYWGNRFVKIHKETGAAEPWKVPFPVDIKGKNGYFFAGSVGGFAYLPDKQEILFWHAPERQWYQYDKTTKKFSKIAVTFDKDELKQHADGFREISEAIQYGCYEDAFNSLENFIEGKITGNPHNRERQVRAFEKIAANPDGTSGEKIYRFVLGKLAMKEE